MYNRLMAEGQETATLIRPEASESERNSAIQALLSGHIKMLGTREKVISALDSRGLVPYIVEYSSTLYCRIFLYTS